MFEFLLYALIAGTMLAITAAPLGCFIIWRKMAYFGDAIAHSALLGVVLGLSWQLPITLAIIPIALAIAFLLSVVSEKSRFSSDTLLGIFAHGGLALGVTVMALTPNLQVDLMAYLFGDILAVTLQDMVIIYGAALMVLTSLWRYNQAFILMTLSEDMARIRGLNIDFYRLYLMLLIALTVAVSIKLVGLLLITSLLILPAAIARFLTHTPLQMMGVSIIAALLMMVGGLFGSVHFDIPSGPAIVLVGVVIFIALAVIGRVRRKIQN